MDRSSGGCVGFVFMLIMVGMGILSILSVTQQRSLYSELDSTGTRVQGVIVDHDSSSGKHNYLDVSYEANGHRQKSFDVVEADFSRLRDGSKVTVAYRASDPYKAKLEGVQMAQYPPTYIGLGIGLIFAGVGLFAALAVWASTGPAQDL